MAMWWWSLTLLVAASFCSDAQAQLAVGPNGVSTPPINLLSVFRFLREIFNAYMNNEEPSTQQSKSESPAKEQAESREDSNHPVTVMGYDTEGNVIEKFDSICDEETDECMNLNAENKTEDAFSQVLVQDKTGTTQLVLGKWPILYIVFIITLSWLLIVIASPYVIAGESIGRREDDPLEASLIDQQDVFLLLAFLLGEVSDNNACLERVVCMTPSKSSNYITISSMIFKLAKYFESWGVPYSGRYVDLLDKLNHVAHDGFSQRCDSYFCPSVPDM